MAEGLDADTLPQRPSAQPFRFTGEQHDSDAVRGLYYLRARYYDPGLGRFWSKDRVMNVQRYAYVGNNPTNYVDPTGDCRIEVRLRKVGPGPSIPKTPFGVQAWHTYIFTSDPIDKSIVAYHGGPGNPGGGFGRSLSDFFGFDSYGDLTVRTASDSLDFSGPSKVVHDEEKESCNSWRRTFAERGRLINSWGINYEQLGPNSNSVTHSRLAAAGLSTKKPGARRIWTDRYWIPGWDDVGP